MTEQSQLGPSDQGSVMLDIGGDVGALIIHTDVDLLLAEIEVSRVDGGRPIPAGLEVAHADAGHTQGGHTEGGHSHGGHSHGEGHTHTHADPTRTHVAVRERRAPSGVRYAAIYPGLFEGEYTVWGLDGAARDSVTVRGGEVVELDWR